MKATYRTPAIVASCAVTGFAVLAVLVTHGVTQSVDETLLQAMRTADDPAVTRGSVSLADVARDFTALGSENVLVVLASLVVAYLAMQGHRGAALTIALTSLGGLGVGTALKMAFDRTRPTVVPHLQTVDHSSFPSGHSMHSAIIYLTLGTVLASFTQKRHLRRYFVGAALFLTAIVGLSRLVLGVHYPSDVAAGWCAGIAWAAICRMVVLRLQKNGEVEETAMS